MQRELNTISFLSVVVVDIATSVPDERVNARDIPLSISYSPFRSPTAYSFNLGSDWGEFEVRGIRTR